jgi:hypothetical protein
VEYPKTPIPSDTAHRKQMQSEAALLVSGNPSVLFSFPVLSAFSGVMKIHLPVDEPLFGAMCHKEPHSRSYLTA